MGYTMMEESLLTVQNGFCEASTTLIAVLLLLSGRLLSRVVSITRAQKLGSREVHLGIEGPENLGTLQTACWAAVRVCACPSVVIPSKTMCARDVEQLVCPNNPARQAKDWGYCK